MLVRTPRFGARQAELLLELVRCAPVIAYDTETTGLDPHADHVIGYVVATPQHSLYVPVRHSGGGNAVDNPVAYERALAQAFALRSRLGLRTTMHNASFDLWMSAKQGVLLAAPLEDTSINAVLLNDMLLDYSLAACAERAGVTPKLGDALHAELARFERRGSKNVMKHLHRLPGDHPLVQDYASGDGVTTLELWAAQQPLLARHGLGRVHALECALIPHLARLRRRGIRVSEEAGRQAIATVRQEVAKLRLHFPSGFRPNANADVLDWMKGQGVHAFPATKTGKESTARAAIVDTEPGGRVIALRELEKLEGAFIRPILEKHRHNGRIYPELVQAKNDHGRGTHTGRFSCANPNLQQWPKRNETIARIVRPLILPDPGFDLAESDVSQQEPRLYAAYGDERSLIDGYNAIPPTDVHTLTAQLMGIPRPLAKTLGLSIFNGMQAPTLSARLGVGLREAESLIQRFFESYPGIRTFTLQAPRVAQEKGYVRTVLGRICHLHYGDSRIAVSRIIQGSGADQMKMLLLRACEYADAHPHIQVLMSIHDSLLWQRRRGGDSTEFLRVLEDNSEFYRIVGGQQRPMPVAFPLETHFGRNWAEASGL